MNSQPTSNLTQPSPEQEYSEAMPAGQSPLPDETVSTNAGREVSSQPPVLEMPPAMKAPAMLAHRPVDQQISAHARSDQGGDGKSLFAEALERYSAERRSDSSHQAASQTHANRRPSPQSLHLESDFYDEASDLWEHGAKQISEASGLNSNQSLLSYVFSENAYQLITARADQVFARDMLARLIERTRAWSQQNLGLSHVSTPQLRIYASGCWRNVMRDDIPASWHYILALTKSSSNSLGKLKIVTEATSDAAKSRISAARVVTTRLTFNQFLTHDVNMPYGVDVAKTSRGPLEGMVFLEGYIW